MISAFFNEELRNHWVAAAALGQSMIADDKVA
jgi:hypothetical protein